jgi:hypothetical protein
VGENAIFWLASILKGGVWKEKWMAANEAAGKPKRFGAFEMSLVFPQEGKFGIFLAEPKHRVGTAIKQSSRLLTLFYHGRQDSGDRNLDSPRFAGLAWDLRPAFPFLVIVYATFTVFG